MVHKDSELHPKSKTQHITHHIYWITSNNDMTGSITIADFALKNCSWHRNKPHIDQHQMMLYSGPEHRKSNSGIGLWRDNVHIQTFLCLHQLSPMLPYCLLLLLCVSLTVNNLPFLLRQCYLVPPRCHLVSSCRLSWRLLFSGFLTCEGEDDMKKMIKLNKT